MDPITETGILLEGGLSEVGLIASAGSSITYGIRKGLTRLVGHDPLQDYFDHKPQDNMSGLRSRKRGRTNTYFTPAPTANPSLRGVDYAINNGKSRYHNLLGTSPFRKTTKRNEISATTSVTTDKRLYFHRLVSTETPSSTDEVSRRNGKEVHIRGVRYDAWFDIRENSLITRPQDIRWAVLNPRNNDGSRDAIGAGQDFFSTNGNFVDDGDIAFPASGDWFDYMTKSINRRDYGVVREGRFTIDAAHIIRTSFTVPDGAPEQQVIQPASMQKHLSFYLPIQKKMKFGDDDSAFPETNLYFVWWFVERASTDQLQRYDATNAPVRHRYRRITFFSDLDHFK